MSSHSQNTPPENTIPIKRTRMVRMYPTHTLKDACGVGAAIQEKNAGLPFDRVLLAKALGTTPASSSFTMKLNSSIKYGLTRGGYNDARIVLTPRGGAIVAPQRSGERRQALLDAALEPELFRRFFQMLDGKRVPEDTYAQNMLQREFGVLTKLTDECLQIIKSNGLYVGILGEVGGSIYVSLAGAHLSESVPDIYAQSEYQSSEIGHTKQIADTHTKEQMDMRHKDGRIFIGHSGTPAIVDFVKTVLDEFEIQYEVAETDYDSQRPITAEVSTRMRECSAAILVFAKPSLSRVSGGREVPSTDVMLYQLGAASVLYGERVISLREKEMQTTETESSLQPLEFDPERLEDLGLALMSELYRLGAIEVQASLLTPETS